MDKIFFERDWGFLAGEISRYKFDFFPRLTVIAAKYVFEINIGFCCFRLWLTIYSKEMRNLTARIEKQSGNSLAIPLIWLFLCLVRGFLYGDDKLSSWGI